MSKRTVHKIYTKKEKNSAYIIAFGVVIVLSAILAFGTITFCNDIVGFLNNIV